MPITHNSDATGLSLYALFNDGDDTAVTLTEGSSLKAYTYTASDAAIVTAGLAAGSYTFRVLIGSAASPAATDPLVGTGAFLFDGANEITTSDLLTDIGAISVITTQPRINYKPSIKLNLASRNDGVYVCDKPVRLLPGSFDTDKAVGIKTTPFFGRTIQTATVGTCTISGGSITATALGPRDEYAMIQLGGTASASESRTVDCELTMDNKDQIVARFTIEVAAS